MHWTKVPFSRCEIAIYFVGSALDVQSSSSPQKKIETVSIHLRRIPISRFCLHGLNAALLLCVCPLAVSEDSVPSTNEYETPGQVNAEDFLPKSAFAGKRLFVEKVAQNNGLQNTYRIRAGAETYEITGSKQPWSFCKS
jgi:hypothetical protein